MISSFLLTYALSSSVRGMESDEDACIDFNIVCTDDNHGGSRQSVGFTSRKINSDKSDSRDLELIRHLYCLFFDFTSTNLQFIGTRNTE